jgi:hypothetical protein
MSAAFRPGAPVNAGRMGESGVLPAFTAIYAVKAGSGLGLPVLPALTGAPRTRRNRPTLP